MSVATPNSTPIDAEIIEADKRSILTKILEPDFLKRYASTAESNQFTNKGSINDPTSSSNEDISSQWKSFLIDEEVDNSEEIFNRVLKKAGAAFLREQEEKKNNPFYVRPKQYKLSPKRKRKVKTTSKDIERALEIMDNFKKTLSAHKLKSIQSKKALGITNGFKRSLSTQKCQSIQSTIPAFNSQTNEEMHTIKSKTTSNRSSILSSILRHRNVVNKPYPKWQHTATYTPIFHQLTNPRWNNKNFPILTQDYTDETHRPDVTAHFSKGSVRDKATICNSVQPQIGSDNSSPSSNLINSSILLQSSSTHNERLSKDHSIDNQSSTHSRTHSSIANPNSLSNSYIWTEQNGSTHSSSPILQSMNDERFSKHRTQMFNTTTHSSLSSKSNTLNELYSPVHPNTSSRSTTVRFKPFTEYISCSSNKSLSSSPESSSAEIKEKIFCEETLKSHQFYACNQKYTESLSRYPKYVNRNIPHGNGRCQYENIREYEFYEHQPHGRLDNSNENCMDFPFSAERFADFAKNLRKKIAVNYQIQFSMELKHTK